MKLIETLPNSTAGRRLGDQLLRSGTSVGANYRAACRARSTAEFRSRLGVVEEEADESAFWLELMVESGLVGQRRVGNLLQEAGELTAIMTASRKTLQRNRKTNLSRKSAI